MRFVDMLYSRLGLLSENIRGAAIVELSGSDRVLLENYDSILLVERERVIFAVSYGQLIVCGTALVLEHLDKERVLIRGEISEISLNRE